MADLRFDSVRKEFDGGVVAVEGFTLTIPSPTMTVLVGPSGCGKTTLLRMIAGLETPTSGDIHLGDRRLDTLPARDRDIAMVFQSYALYPHMTVGQNLSFGLRLRKLPRDVVEKRVREVAETLEIDALLDRKPGALSGGQRQRVALGRAIIREPRVFLFDEPLSNLDARLRTEMRTTIKQLYQRLGVTSIYVTHDQVEAMTIGEQLVVMNKGRVHQVGTPHDCYHRPADTFVAAFLGSPSMNLLEGAYRPDTGVFETGGSSLRLTPDLGARIGGAAGDVVLGVRPEDLLPAPPEGGHVELTGAIRLEEPLGHETLTYLDMAGRKLVARGAGEFSGDSDGQTTLYIESGSVHLFDRQSGARLGGADGPMEA